MSSTVSANGWFGFGRFGVRFGFASLTANQDQFTFKSIFTSTRSIPTNSIKSLTPFVGIPYWSWGILIEHNCPEHPSPIYFGTIGRPSTTMKQLATLPFNPEVQIDLTTTKGIFPC
jgi:hypothetical protein